MISLRSEYMPPAAEWEFNEMVSEVERLRQLNETLVLENKELRRRVTVLEQFVEFHGNLYTTLDKSLHQVEYLPNQPKYELEISHREKEMAECKDEKSVKKRPVTAPATDDESHLKSCCICCEEISIFAVGSCDHAICYKCSARMRVLSKQTYCATCRAEMKEVVVSFQKKKFSEFNIRAMKVKRPNGFFFEDRRLSESFDALFDNVCVECPDLEKPFISLDDLRTHIRRVHEKQFCQICLDALSNFPSELKTYTKKELVSHRKEGDVGDRSHRGHPECKFCNDRFVDNDTLLFHLRKSHFWCHFCEHDGKQEYYNVYKDLRFHFGEFHFLCDEGECRHEKFTSVFRDKIDYQAHKLAHHGKNFNKIQAKEARKIEFDYSYRRRQQQQPASVVTGSDYAEVNSAEARASSSRGDNRGRNQNTMDFSNFEDVEKMRQDMKKEKEKGKDTKQNRSIQRQDNKKASNVPAPTNTIQASKPRDDEDIIGMPEHINKKVEEKEKPIPEQKNQPREEPVTNKASPRPEPKVRERVMEDFPSLPGGAPVPNVQLPKKTKEEEFPALGKPVVRKEIENQKQAGKPELTVLNGIPVTVKKKKEKGKSWTQQSGRANLASVDDFPSLQSIDLNQNVKDSKTTAKSSMVSNNKPFQDDFQVVQTSNRSKGKPPPGLNEHRGHVLSNGKGPPPQQEKRSISNGKGPPGFSSPVLRNKDDKPPGFAAMAEPTLESNIRERNMRLVALLETYLDDFNLQIFKNVSGDFRREKMPAFEYYSAISELLGDNLRFVFSELVALLPDEKKSEELLKAHQNAKVLAKQKEDPSPVHYNTQKRTVWGSNPTSKNQNTSKSEETRCQDCGQTFSREEMIKHMESHGEAFPSLPTTTQKKKFLPFKSVHQSQTKNAWGR